MSTIRRIFVEKKDAFAVEAHGLLSDLRNNLGMKNLTGIRILNRYDVMGVSDEEFIAARKIVLSEPPVDTVTDEAFAVPAGSYAFAVEYLPGQYDQREDFAEQAIQLITQKDRPTVASAKVYVLEGRLSEADLDKIKSYCINPVEAREAGVGETRYLDRYLRRTSPHPVAGRLFDPDTRANGSPASRDGAGYEPGRYAVVPEIF